MRTATRTRRGARRPNRSQMARPKMVKATVISLGGYDTVNVAAKTADVVTKLQAATKAGKYAEFKAAGRTADKVWVNPANVTSVSERSVYL